MRKIIEVFLRKIVFAFGIIYGVNIILRNVNINIPMNIPTIFITTFLGIPGLLSIFILIYLLK